MSFTCPFWIIVPATRDAEIKLLARAREKLNILKYTLMTHYGEKVRLV